jgi:hypothetical protein
MRLPKDQDTYDLNALAVLFEVHPETIRRWVDEGRFPKASRKGKRGRIEWEADTIIALLRENCQCWLRKAKSQPDYTLPRPNELNEDIGFYDDFLARLQKFRTHKSTALEKSADGDALEGHKARVRADRRATFEAIQVRRKVG